MHPQLPATHSRRSSVSNDIPLHPDAVKSPCDPSDSSQPLFHQEKSDESASSVRFPFAPSDKSFSGSASLADSLRRVDQDSPPSLPLSLSLDNTIPQEPSLSEHTPSQDPLFQSEPPKRRPLPTPPASIPHSSSSARLSRISEIIPSSPPPPYSRFLPDDDSIPMTRDLSRTSPPPHPPPAPEAPVIMSPLPNEQGASTRPPYDSFLCHSPPANTWIAVETSFSEYVLLVRLPSFRRDGITIATRRRRILHIVADSWEPEGGHFERRVSFGYDAELAQVRAEFDGEMLRIVVPRRATATSS